MSEPKEINIKGANVNKLKNNYTTIIISHSKNAIKYCDAVYEIIDGKLIKIEL